MKADQTSVATSRWMREAGCRKLVGRVYLRRGANDAPSASGERKKDGEIYERKKNKKLGPRGSQLPASGNQQPVTSRENEGQTASSTQHPICTKAQSARTSREISKELTNNWPKIKQELEHYGRYLTKWNLVKAITILSEARKYRFLRRRKPKYGSMNKAFTDEELEHFFSVIRDPKLHLLFSYQAILGLRIGEAVRVHIKDINLKTRELRIFTEKSDKTDYLLIPEALFDRTVRHINSYGKDITAARGFLFFSFEAGRRFTGTEPHYTTETARKFFRKYANKAKLEEIYGYSAGQKPHELRRLTPHSLRHYAITNFCRKNGGNVMLAAKFARHTNLQITMTYIHAKKEELYESIERANDENLLRRVREMQEKV